MITVKIEGMQATMANLAGLQKQVRYAASRALNNVAFKANAEIKDEMRSTFQGGVTPWVQRAFRVDRATRESLTAVVALRDDQNYSKALRHLFTSGTRQWKLLEGWLRARQLIPTGMMAVPGDAIALDARGNIRKAQLDEMLGVLGSKVRNLRIFYWRGGVAGKKSVYQTSSKELGFFVVMPGSTAARHLHPGVWRRIEQARDRGKGMYRSHVQPYVMYVRRGRWRQFINLHQIGSRTVAKHWRAEFDAELTKALANAK